MSHFQKARIVESQVDVHESKSHRSAVIAKLKAGDEIEIGICQKAEGSKWQRTFLRDGRTGWIDDAKMNVNRWARLKQKSCPVFKTPSREAELCKSLKRFELFLIFGVERHGGEDWVRVCDKNGVPMGFIEGKTAVQNLAPPDTIVFDLKEYRPFLFGVIFIDGFIIPSVALLIWGFTSHISWIVAIVSFLNMLISMFLFRKDGTVSSSAYAWTGMVGYIISALAGQTGILVARSFKKN